MKEKLSVLTNIAMLVFLVVVGVIYVKTQLSSGQQYSQVKVGDKVTALPSYSWVSHPRTLILAVRSGCHFCEESVPFYKKLAALEAGGRTNGTHIVAAFFDDELVAQKTLQQEGLLVDHIPSVSFRDLKIAGTPTVMLVDDQKRVMKVWQGKLPSSEEQRVLESLGAPSGRLIMPSKPD